MSEPMTEQVRVSERLAPVLGAAAERIHYAEGRRANYSVMAGALVAAGIAILTFASGSIDLLWMRLAASYGAIASIATGAVVIWLYGQQTNRYPFTAATKTWKWFYRDALPDRKAFNFSPIGYLWWGLDQRRVEAAYSAQLVSFRDQNARLSDDQVNLDQDVEQLYVLHVTDLYKNLFLKHLRWTFNLGVVAIVAAAMWGGFEGLRRDSAAREPKTYPIAANPFARVATAKRLSPLLAAEPVFAVSVTLSNHTRAHATWDTLVPLDAQGWPLPAEVSYPYGKPEALAAGQTVATMALLKMRRDTADELRGFGVHFK